MVSLLHISFCPKYMKHVPNFFRSSHRNHFSGQWHVYDLFLVLYLAPSLLVSCSLICLKHIYNFWWFYAIIISFSYTFYINLYVFWTNLLIQCLVSDVVFCMFLILQKINIFGGKKNSKDLIQFFQGMKVPGSIERKLEEPQGLTRPSGTVKALAGSLCHVAPCTPPYVHFSAYKSHISQNPSQDFSLIFSVGASFCFEEIKSGGMFRICRRLFHQPCCHHDHVWVVLYNLRVHSSS